MRGPKSCFTKLTSLYTIHDSIRLALTELENIYSYTRVRHRLSFEQPSVSIICHGCQTRWKQLLFWNSNLLHHIIYYFRKVKQFKFKLPYYYTSKCLIANRITYSYLKISYVANDLCNQGLVCVIIIIIIIAKISYISILLSNFVQQWSAVLILTN